MKQVHPLNNEDICMHSDFEVKAIEKPRNLMIFITLSH